MSRTFNTEAEELTYLIEEQRLDMKFGFEKKRTWDSFLSLNLMAPDGHELIDEIDSEYRSLPFRHVLISKGDCGTVGAYTNQRCRCTKCRAAWAAYSKQSSHRRSRKGKIPHGTHNGYNNYRCRCAECREAKGTYVRRMVLS